MSLEGFSKRGMELGNNPEDINETKNDLRQQYLSAIKRLALDKMKNDILFEGKLGATIRNLSSTNGISHSSRIGTSYCRNPFKV